MKFFHQKNYMAQVKNSMLLHFNHKDISSTLRDLNELFESGKYDGKTDVELYDELGSPKDLVNKLLHENHSNKFPYILFAYIASAFAICIFIAYIFNSTNPLCWCIPVVIVPIYIWHLCGVSCLYKFQNDYPNQKSLYIISVIVSFISVIMQQILVALLNTSEKMINSNTFKTCLFTSYYVSLILIVIFILFSVLTIYTTYYGDYLSVNYLLIALGTICSSRSYIIYIKFFNGPNMLSSVCSLPYIFSVFLSLLLFRFLHKKG